MPKRKIISFMRVLDRSANFRFFDLPGEIRNIIYRFALNGDAEPFEIGSWEWLDDSYKTSKKAPFVAFLQASKQTYAEGRYIMYESTSLRLAADYTFIGNFQAAFYSAPIRKTVQSLIHAAMEVEPELRDPREYSSAIQNLCHHVVSERILLEPDLLDRYANIQKLHIRATRGLYPYDSATIELLDVRDNLSMLLQLCPRLRTVRIDVRVFPPNWVDRWTFEEMVTDLAELTSVLPDHIKIEANLLHPDDSNARENFRRAVLDVDKSAGGETLMELD